MRTRSIQIIVASLIMLTCRPCAAVATDKPSQFTRPKIGLVLSGGGARGGAEIGVLKVLEELRIPIDYIAGTSIGSIVGGLYASGNTADEVKKILASLDWPQLLNDKPERQDLSFRRKQDDFNFLIPASLGFNHWKVTLPQGLIQGQNILMEMKVLTRENYGRISFDELPIPYRAVATDICTGDEVVIKEGELARAMRASMALHGVFAPVPDGDQLLIDGGYINNLPVNVARSMGADIVIAVNVGTPPENRDSLRDFTHISKQVISVNDQRYVNQQIASLKPTDFLITPEIGVTMMEFSKTAETIADGEKAARAIAAKLRALSLPEDEYRRWRLAHQRRSYSPPVIDRIQIKKKSQLSDKVILSALHLKTGQPLDLEHLQKDIADLYGLGYFERIEFHIEKMAEKNILVVEVIDKSWGPNFLRFGVNLQSDFKGSSYYTVGLRHTATELNALGAELETNVQTGRDVLFGMEWYQPVDYRQRFFVAPLARHEQRMIDVVNNGRRVAEYRFSINTAEIGAGRQISDWGEVRAGTKRESATADLELGEPQTVKSSYDSGFLFARLSLDKLDNVRFPKSGSLGNVEYDVSRKAVGAETGFDKFHANYDLFHTFQRTTISIGGTYGTVTGGTAPIQDAFPLGGFLKLSGALEDEFRGQDVALGRLLAYQQIGKIVGMALYCGGSLEKGNVWDHRTEMSWNSAKLAGSVFFGLDTYLGPIYLSYGRTEGEGEALYAFLGQRFNVLQ